jgi:hypothetical protein
MRIWYERVGNAAKGIPRFVDISCRVESTRIVGDGR